ncbi:MAG TPA: hypothetical protein VK425_00650, partial [Acidimicrobiales bacterium]|nr:hypothetical protein [Acidimicrobiales bacterium]
STGQQPGPWFPWLGEVFGVAHHLRYGVADTVEDDEVTFRFVAAVGELGPGSTLRFPVGAPSRSRAFLPVEPASAQVLAVDGQGRPALLRAPTGEGSMVLCTYPIEHLAASRANANPEDTWRLYSALATLAGVDRPVRCEDARVLVGGLTLGDGGEDVFILMNASPEQAPAVLAAPGKSLTPFGRALSDGGAPADLAPLSGGLSGELVLAPYEVVVLRARSSVPEI